MTARRVAICAVVALAATARAADADPTVTNAHIASPSTCKTDGGTDLRLPPGYFLDEPTHQHLDDEMKRLQDVETRLTAENASLKSAVSGWQPGWVTLGLTIAAGAALGWYAEKHL